MRGHECSISDHGNVNGRPINLCESSPCTFENEDNNKFITNLKERNLVRQGREVFCGEINCRTRLIFCQVTELVQLPSETIAGNRWISPLRSFAPRKAKTQTAWTENLHIFTGRELDGWRLHQMQNSPDRGWWDKTGQYLTDMQYRLLFKPDKVGLVWGFLAYISCTPSTLRKQTNAPGAQVIELSESLGHNRSLTASVQHTSSFTHSMVTSRIDKKTLKKSPRTSPSYTLDAVAQSWGCRRSSL